MTRPQQGQVWERDGLRREVVEVKQHHGEYVPHQVTWCRPGSSATSRCWSSTWGQWARHATLVRERFGVEA